jgi:integrase/recombinase XerD
MRLDDIEWHDGTILVRAAKSRRERSLPLPADVGAALAVYLRDGRPASALREVFLTARPPYRALDPSSVVAIVARAMTLAGVPVARRGAHVFRHTVATRMVRGGASFKQVADVLGHARIETTAIYAKLDLATLARVALAWPGVES